ncbi:MAG: hypothetical protein CMD70_01065 [Gammaproteobacteria bacterium]|nr:hypothetical protein [Gammaproteobacteria bacterium]
MRKLIFTIIILIFSGINPSYGHHSATIFDRTAVSVFYGTVTSFTWTNPHVYIYVETETADGELVEWEVETDATPILTRSGWTSESLTPGDQVLVRAYPDKRTDKKHALLVSISTEEETLAARSYFLRKTDDTTSRASASDISGVWELGFTDFREFYEAWAQAKLTDKGIESKASYTVLSGSPQARCIAIPTPASLISPNLNEVVINENSILIRNERFNVERTIYTDGRAHPEEGIRSNQGHSIGKWEGDTLVVDTILFEPHRSPVIGSGIASGLEKHVTERFSLRENGTQLHIDYVLEDPEHLEEPFTGTVVWHYAPHFPMLGFDCDPENASRFTLR